MAERIAWHRNIKNVEDEQVQKQWECIHMLYDRVVRLTRLLDSYIENGKKSWRKKEEVKRRNFNFK